MNHLSLLSILLLAIALPACSTTDGRQTRIERNPEIYQGLPANDRALVDQGRVREGMSKKAVFLALGKPDDITRGSKRGVNYETWGYSSFQPVVHPYAGFGLGYGHYGHPYRRHYHDPYWAGAYPYMGAATMYQRRPVFKVELLNDKVIGWEGKQ